MNYLEEFESWIAVEALIGRFGKKLEIRGENINFAAAYLQQF